MSIASSVLLILLLVTFAARGESTTRSFPQSNEPLFNRDSSYDLRVESDANLDDAHTLILHSHNRSSSARVMRFGRSINVGWSPDGRKFFVNNRISSDETDCRIAEIEFGGLLKWIDIDSTPTCGPQNGPGHCYRTCISWIDSRTISGRFEYYDQNRSLSTKEVLTVPEH